MDHGQFLRNVRLNCNAGYEKKTDPITHRESCEKTETCLKGQYKD